MGAHETALQLTLKAVEHGHIKFMLQSGHEEINEKTNAFNAKQISDFLLAVEKSLGPGLISP